MAIENHKHNGVDAPQVNPQDLEGFKINTAIRADTASHEGNIELVQDGGTGKNWLQSFIGGNFRKILFDGVHTLIAGNGITLSPSSGVGDVTVTAGTMRVDAGFETYSQASDDGVQKTITVADETTSQNFKPKFIIAIGRGPLGQLLSVGVCTFNDTAVAFQNNWPEAGGARAGGILSWATGSPDNDMLLVNEATSTGFKWTPEFAVASGDMNLVWLAIGFQ